VIRRHRRHHQGVRLALDLLDQRRRRLDSQIDDAVSGPA
jgi:hypothetical protein